MSTPSTVEQEKDPLDLIIKTKKKKAKKQANAQHTEPEQEKKTAPAPAGSDAASDTETKKQVTFTPDNDTKWSTASCDELKREFATVDAIRAKCAAEDATLGTAEPNEDALRREKTRFADYIPLNPDTEAPFPPPGAGVRDSAMHAARRRMIEKWFETVDKATTTVEALWPRLSRMPLDRAAAAEDAQRLEAFAHAMTYHATHVPGVLPSLQYIDSLPLDSPARAEAIAKRASFRDEAERIARTAYGAGLYPYTARCADNAARPAFIILPAALHALRLNRLMCHHQNLANIAPRRRTMTANDKRVAKAINTVHEFIVSTMRIGITISVPVSIASTFYAQLTELGFRRASGPINTLQDDADTALVHYVVTHDALTEQDPHAGAALMPVVVWGAITCIVTASGAPVSMGYLAGLPQIPGVRYNTNARVADRTPHGPFFLDVLLWRAPSRHPLGAMGATGYMLPRTTMRPNETTRAALLRMIEAMPSRQRTHNAEVIAKAPPGTTPTLLRMSQPKYETLNVMVVPDINAYRDSSVHLALNVQVDAADLPPLLSHIATQPGTEEDEYAILRIPLSTAQGPQTRAQREFHFTPPTSVTAPGAGTRICECLSTEQVDEMRRPRAAAHEASSVDSGTEHASAASTAATPAGAPNVETLTGLTAGLLHMMVEQYTQLVQAYETRVASAKQTQTVLVAKKGADTEAALGGDSRASTQAPDADSADRKGAPDAAPVQANPDEKEEIYPYDDDPVPSCPHWARITKMQQPDGGAVDGRHTIEIFVCTESPGTEFVRLADDSFVMSQGLVVPHLGAVLRDWNEAKGEPHVTDGVFEIRIVHEVADEGASHAVANAIRAAFAAHSTPAPKRPTARSPEATTKTPA